MSRLGKQPIAIPNGVTVKVQDGVLNVTGPKGTLERATKENLVSIEVNEDQVTVNKLDSKDNHAHALWGTFAAHLKNMIEGVTEGFTKILEIEGVGYRADIQGNKLVMQVGYSHPVDFDIPEGVEVKVEKNVITMTSHDKEVLGQFAANVRAIRPPEPYKGKGIHYRGEYIIRKQGKKAV